MRKTCKEIIFKSGMSEIPTGKNILHKAATWSNSTKKKVILCQTLFRANILALK